MLLILFLTALATNEFRSSRYGKLMPDGRELGEVLLSTKGLKTEKYWMWLGIVIDVGFLIAYSIISTAALTYLDYSESYSTATAEQIVTTKAAPIQEADQVRWEAAVTS